MRKNVWFGLVWFDLLFIELLKLCSWIFLLKQLFLLCKKK